MIEQQQLIITNYKGVFVRPAHYAFDSAVVDEVITTDCYAIHNSGFNDLDEPVVVDIGAHIGTFALLCHAINPSARIACVEVAPENIPVLCANVGNFAEVIHAACIHGDQPLTLLNTMIGGIGATGGSRLAPTEAAGHMASIYHDAAGLPFYVADDRPVRRVSIADIMAQLGADYIDLLKVDCEGSEYNVLVGADIGRIGVIVGEFHDADLWQEFVGERFTGWRYEELSRQGPLGTFRLINPARRKAIHGST